MTTPTLLLLDGHSLAYRAFYALPVENFATTTGQPTNAVYGFTSMLINAIRDEQPTHIAVAFDLSRQTFRSQEFPEYKATRSASPAEFAGQVGLIQEVLAALGVTTLTAEGFEADDIIATLTAQARAADWEVRILSGDRDTFQLVDEATTVLYPKRGVSDLDRITPAAVVERYGLTPQQYPDFAALRGDPSDNLPSIPGVGEKTAAKWITQFGSLTGLVDGVESIGGKTGAALRENLAQVLQNRRLTELVRDVPVTVDLAALTVEPYDPGSVDGLFDSLQFRVLRERLPQAWPGAVADSGGAGAADLAVTAVGAEGPQDWLAAHTTDAGVAVEVKGRGSAIGGETISIALAAGDAAAWFDVASLSPAAEQRWAQWLGDPSAAKLMHDAKPALHALAGNGWRLAGLTCDTALAAYLVQPGRRTFDLDELAQQYTGIGAAGSGGGDEAQLAFEEESAGADLAARAAAVARLAEPLKALLSERGGELLLTEVELPLQSVLREMESTGIAVDDDRLAELARDYGSRAAAAETAAHAAVGHPFNLGSPKQLQAVLFDELELPKTKRIKTGYTTDAEALQSLFAATGHPVLEQLLQHRDATRLLVTVEGLRRAIATDGRIHTTFNQTVAATGRLSSTEPNLQNIPIRTPEGRRIREAFVVGAGFDELLTADYSQIEMRIMAHLSGDAGLIAAFRSGEDLHTSVAAMVFDTDTVDAEQRSRIKAMSYGLAYGLSAYGLSQQLGIDPAEATALMDRYFERFGGVRDYLQSVVAEARTTGYTETILGRRRYLPDLTSDNRQRREMAERMALNAPIQGSAADIVKVAMLRVTDAFTEAGLRSRLLLQVHDELVVEVAPGERETAESLVRAGMAAAADLAVPLEVSVGHGQSWDAAAH